MNKNIVLSKNQSADNFQDEIFIKMTARKKIALVCQFYKTAKKLGKLNPNAKRANTGRPLGLNR